MSLKIHGNLSPAVGKEEKYTIKEPFEGFNIFPPPIQPIDHKVKWYVYVLENGKWRKTKENDKTGETVSYTFTQKSLSRKGIKIEVQRGFETASEVIKPQRAEEQKILKVELLDAQENKLTKPLSYGQTVVAKATCTGLEYQMVSLTLWEDDAKGAGHSPINQKNRATTKTVEVKRGIAKTSFKLMPSFDKMAKAFQTAGGEGKLHEYYVTASIQDTLSASNNIDVKALEKPVPPVKKKVPVIDPKKPRPNVPKSSTPTKPSVKKEITDVKLFKTSETTLKAHVYYNGLQGKKIRFKLMEDDGGALFNDENQVFDLPKNSDCLYIDIDLKKVSKSKGDDMLEGNEQELFVDIEVIETALHHKTGTIDVDITAFGTDPVDDTNKVVKVGEEKKESKDCGEKYCIKKGSPNSELIREINIRLAGFGGNVPTDEFTDRTEKMIKQFQRDYMKVPETGKVCGNVLKAIDEFSQKFDVSEDVWKQIDCSCSTKGQEVKSKLRGIKEKNNCNGWGDHSGKGTYKTGSEEKNHKYEYPGIHRSLLFGFKAMLFYLSKQDTYKFREISSGYRCRFKNYMTTNHQGKALDIQFNKGSWKIAGAERRNLVELRKIRDDIFHKYLNAKTSWIDGDNNFCLEPIDLIYKDDGSIDKNYTYSWIHFDVREFDPKYLDDKYFCKNSQALNGIGIVQLAKDFGLNDLCNCIKSFTSQNKPDDEKKDINGRVDPKTLKISNKGKQFIKDWEKFEPKAYNDSEGYCTIGYGHLIKRKKCENIIIPDEFKNGITEKRAAELFELRLPKFEEAIKRDIIAPLYQHEYDALVSLVFNTGPEFLNTGGKNNGETQIKKKINNKEYEAGADEMSDVTNGGTSGLVKRRKAEINIFKNNVYDSTH